MTIQGWSRSLNNGKIGAGTGAKIMEKVELELEPNLYNFGSATLEIGNNCRFILFFLK